MDQAFPSDLTDRQWQLIEPILPKARSGGRPRSTSLRQVVNAIFYLNRTGCQWRYLPPCFPPWQTVYDYYRKWILNGIWIEIHFTIYFLVRRKLGRSVFPSLAIVDAQSIRAASGENRAADHFKKVIGRKRSILVDSLGFMIGCYVHKANDQDCTGLEILLERLFGFFKEHLQKIIGDMGYRYPYLKYRCQQSNIQIETIDRKVHGTNMKHKRWVVERSFAWFNHYRRNSRDYEKACISSEASLYISQIQLLLRRAGSFWTHFSDILQWCRLATNRR